MRKVAGSAGALTGRGDETLTAVVEVSEPGYVPSATHRRAALSDTMFTAELQRRALPELESDPRVVSVDLGRPLGPAA